MPFFSLKNNSTVLLAQVMAPNTMDDLSGGVFAAEVEISRLGDKSLSPNEWEVEATHDNFDPVELNACTFDRIK